MARIWQWWQEQWRWRESQWRRRSRWWLGGALVVIVAVVAAVVPRGRHDPAPHTAPQTAPPTTAQAATSPATLPATTVTTAQPSTSAADCAGSTVAGLSMAEQVGQLLMIGAGVDAPSGLQDTVAHYHLGGVFLHGRSTRTAGQLRADIGSLQKSAHLPLLISLDQEGGEVQTLKGPDFPILPTAQKLGAESPGEIASVTTGSARRLAGIGVTINLAPVADTVPASLGRGNPPIGAFHREYGTSPAVVATAIRTVVPASQRAGVLTTLKHFPGLGRVRENTDTSTDAVDDTATVTDPYLEPFVTGIRAGSAAVMISSASYPKLDPKNVAAFSEPIITGLLRDRLGFGGLVMSDDLGAAVAVSAVPAGQRAVRFIQAGGDMVLSIRPPDAAAMVGALMDRAREDPAFAARVTAAATHVVQAKQRAGLITCGY